MDFTALALWYVALLFSLVCHEAAHAWAALRGGDPTAYHGGQVSLDPRPHIQREPFGTIFAPLLAFAWGGWMIGWASTPYDPRWAAAYPKRAAWMALAGPAANALLMVSAAIVIRIGLLLGFFEIPIDFDIDLLVAGTMGGLTDTLASFVSIVFALNLLLLIFNLIPVPPLDGAGALPLVLPDALALRVRVAFANPMWSFFGILVAWITIRQLFVPALVIALRVLYPELS
ncbi:MAG: site-2 protease family protein [Myxococcota bacterium]